LQYRAANIANHYYQIDFLEKIVHEIEPKLEYHVAKKKIPTIDYETGAAVKPSTPNGIKMELFVFDVFPFTSSFYVLEVDRKDDFSPLKNAPGTGVDCPETSRRDLMNQCLEFLEATGAKIPKNRLELNDPEICEISPLVSYGGENLHTLDGVSLKFPILIQSEQDLAKLK
jgi:UDP-N-acetylglucosamine/UDP-N-acetylgalactosamine diphosphorylase